MTPDDVATIRADVNRVGGWHETALALCAALEQAWAERDELAEIEAQATFACNGLRERAERAEERAQHDAQDIEELEQRLAEACERAERAEAYAVLMADGRDAVIAALTERAERLDRENAGRIEEMAEMYKTLARVRDTPDDAHDCAYMEELVAELRAERDGYIGVIQTLHAEMDRRREDAVKRGAEHFAQDAFAKMRERAERAEAERAQAIRFFNETVPPLEAALARVRALCTPPDFNMGPQWVSTEDVLAAIDEETK